MQFGVCCLRWVQGMQMKNILAQCSAMECLLDGMSDAVNSGDDVTKELIASLLLLKINLSALKQSVDTLTPAPVDYSNLISELNNLKPIRGIRI